MTIAPALQQLFNDYIAKKSGFFVARLYTITPAGNAPVIRFTDADCDIVGVSASALVNGFTYSSGGVRVDQQQSKTQAHWKLGLDTDTWTLVVMPRPVDPLTGEPFPDTIGGIPWLQAAQAGSLDAADFQADEAYFSALPTWPMPPGGAVPIGCRTIFAGTIAEIDTTNLQATLVVNDYRSLFSIQMPRRYYQAQCKNSLFDASCGLNQAAFAVPSSVGAGSTLSTIVGNGLAVPSGSKTYRLGSIQMTSGLNAGVWRTVKDWDGSFTLSLLVPLPFAVAPGDTFNAYPGCDKQIATCVAFNNRPNFGGYPNIPPPEVQSGG